VAVAAHAGKSRALAAGAAVLMLAGCMGGATSGDGVTMAAHSPGQELMTSRPERKVEGSAIIADLQSRAAILPGNSSYDRIAKAVIAHSAGAAQAELRVKQLQAEARATNWLPSIGPSVSLNSLGSLVTSLLVDQVLFDNGRKKAEREFAVADVEVAAVNLSRDMNARVAQAVGLFIDAEAAQARASVVVNVLTRLQHFDRIMALRVQGGVSNMSEQTVLRQKVIEMEARLAEDRDRARLALAELQSVTGGTLAPVSGLTQLPGKMPGVTPLAVHLAEAEKERTVAELKIERAGLLPGLSAGGTVGKNGTGIGLNANIANPLTLGTGTAMQAVTAGADAAVARVRQAGQDSARRQQALEMRIANLDRQEAAQRGVAEQTRANLRRFEEQYKAGVRPLMDLVTQHESLATMERDLVDMRHDRARARVEIAQELGLLADGAGI